MKINVVIPMAGNGNRFLAAGYKKPKPFIAIQGKPMITCVLDNLNLPNAHFFLIARKEHLESEKTLVNAIQKRYSVTFIPIENVTEGAACSVLYAHRHIHNEQPLLIANSDQMVDFDVNDFVQDGLTRKLDGSILVFKDQDPKWSYAKVEADGLVSEVKEKVCISPFATVGIYFFAKTKSFVEATLDMIVRNERVNNEFYVCPAFNFAIKNGARIGAYEIAQEKMHGTGTPEDLERYLNWLENGA